MTVIRDDKVDDVLKNYEQVTKDGAAATKGLMIIWEKLGQPTDVSNSVGWAMMDNIVLVWERYFPWEVDEFIEGLRNELATERTVHEAVKADGGYFPVSYPPRLFQLVKTLLPNINLRDKHFVHQFTRRYPVFKTTNYEV